MPLPGEPGAVKVACTVRKGEWGNTVRLCALRLPYDLEAWITVATNSGIDALARFARGLREDLAAVTSGLSLPWSNGPMEGQITRLKLLKRQSYGRAGSALLRQRILWAA